MRKEFCAWAEQEGQKNKKMIFITGDLGYAALENVAKVMGDRFINAGVCEQNMISVAAGMAHDGWEVLCYSIAPFAVFRPAEQIRLDVCIHNKNVKIVGNGGGYGYGIMGATHHAIEDIGVLSTFPKMRCLLPRSNEDVFGACQEMMNYKGPVYLRLNAGSEKGVWEFEPFRPVRLISSPSGSCDLAVFALGPMALNAAQAIQGSKLNIKLFSVSEVPLKQLNSEMKNAIQQSKIIWVVEEHVSRGGLAEHLCLLAAKEGVAINKLIHSSAQGYPAGLYGSQNYHQAQSSLSVDGLRLTLQELDK